MEFAVFGISGAALTALIVELLKSQMNLDGKRAILAAVAVGLLLSALNYVAQLVPGFEAWYKVVIAGLMAGLMACGMYDAAHKPEQETEQ